MDDLLIDGYVNEWVNGWADESPTVKRQHERTVLGYRGKSGRLSHIKPALKVSRLDALPEYICSWLAGSGTWAQVCVHGSSLG